MARLMLVDDEPDMLLLFRVIMDAVGHDVVAEADDGDSAVAWFDGHHDDVDVVVLDYRLPGRTGIEAARDILARKPGQRVVLCSACLDPQIRSEADSIGIACYDKREMQALADDLPA